MILLYCGGSYYNIIYLNSIRADNVGLQKSRVLLYYSLNVRVTTIGVRVKGKDGGERVARVGGDACGIIIIIGVCTYL